MKHPGSLSRKLYSIIGSLHIWLWFFSKFCLSGALRWCIYSMASGRASVRAKTLRGRRNTTRDRPPTVGRREPWRKRTRKPGTRPGKSTASWCGHWWPLSENVTSAFRPIRNWWKSRMQRRPRKLKN